MQHCPSIVSRPPHALSAILATALCVSIAHADFRPGSPRESDDAMARLIAFCGEIGEHPEPPLARQSDHPAHADANFRTSGARWLVNAYTTGELDAVAGVGDLFTYRRSGVETLATGEVYSRSAAQRALLIAIWAFESGSPLPVGPAGQGSGGTGIAAGPGVLDLALLLRDTARAFSRMEPVSPRGTDFGPGGGPSTAMTHTLGGEIIAIPVPHAGTLGLLGCGLVAVRRRPRRARHALG